MRESKVRVLAAMLAVILPASIVLADATSAMLNVNGNVTVNGAPVERAMAVFPGDKVQTGANAIAMLTAEGSSVTVPGNSRLVFSRSQLNVLCGTAVVSTSHGMGVRAGRMIMQPARGVQTRFQVTQSDGELQIVAREGTLAVDNGSTTTALQPGRILAVPGACMAYAAADDQSNSPTGGQSQGQAGQNQGQNKEKKRRAAVPPPTAGSNTSNLLLYGAAAGGVAGFLVWVTTRSSASNTTP